jgi:hypothetical protein
MVHTRDTSEIVLFALYEKDRKVVGTTPPPTEVILALDAKKRRMSTNIWDYLSACLHNVFFTTATSRLIFLRFDQLDGTEVAKEISS